MLANFRNSCAQLFFQTSNYGYNCFNNSVSQIACLLGISFLAYLYTLHLSFFTYIRPEKNVKTFAQLTRHLDTKTVTITHLDLVLVQICRMLVVEEPNTTLLLDPGLALTMSP